FFFSSRRRHTISKRDWSSDVCSSDLTHERFRGYRSSRGRRTNAPFRQNQADRISGFGRNRHPGLSSVRFGGTKGRYKGNQQRMKIGRASCREREKICVGGRRRR